MPIDELHRWIAKFNESSLSERQVMYEELFTFEPMEEGVDQKDLRINSIGINLRYSYDLVHDLIN